MKRVSRTSTAGARYLDLQREARRTGRPTDELIQLYALECFLDRVGHSEFANRLILKGGVLLAALNARRPTRDIDLAAYALRNTEAEILGMVRKIAAISLDDGLEFDADHAAAETIRDQDEYSGIRVTLGGTLSRALIRLHVDVNVGDLILARTKAGQPSTRARRSTVSSRLSARDGAGREALHRDCPRYGKHTMERLRRYPYSDAAS